MDGNQLPNIIQETNQFQVPHEGEEEKEINFEEAQDNP